MAEEPISEDLSGMSWTRQLGEIESSRQETGLDPTPAVYAKMYEAFFAGAENVTVRSGYSMADGNATVNIYCTDPEQAEAINAIVRHRPVVNEQGLSTDVNCFVTVFFADTNAGIDDTPLDPPEHEPEPGAAPGDPGYVPGDVVYAYAKKALAGNRNVVSFYSSYNEYFRIWQYFANFTKIPLQYGCDDISNQHGVQTKLACDVFCRIFSAPYLHATTVYFK